MQAKRKPVAEAIKERAALFLNTPYLWGGGSVFGIDCSGFTQMVFRFFNIPCCVMRICRLPRAKWLAFYRKRVAAISLSLIMLEGRITHVGILLNDP